MVVVVVAQKSNTVPHGLRSRLDLAQAAAPVFAGPLYTLCVIQDVPNIMRLG